MRQTKAKAGMAMISGSAAAATAAHALTTTFTVAVEFFDPFVITETVPASFGRLISGVATTYVLEPTDNLIPGAGGSSTGGTPTAGRYTISDSATGDAIDIVVNNPVANGGVTITAFDCQWNGGAQVDNGTFCSFSTLPNPTSTGQELVVGFDIAVDGTQSSTEAANPAFDVSVLYD